MRTARVGWRGLAPSSVPLLVALCAAWLASCATEVAGGGADDAGGGAGGTSGATDATAGTGSSTGGAYAEDALTREIVERLSGSFDDEAQSTLDGLEFSTLTACRASVEGIDATALYLVQATGGRVENELVIVFDGPLGALGWRVDGGKVAPVLVSPGQGACASEPVALRAEAVGPPLCLTHWSPGESSTPYVGKLCAPALPQGQILTLTMRDGTITWREELLTDHEPITLRTLELTPAVDE